VYSKVLVAVDGSAITPTVLQEAAKLAGDGSQLLVLSVVDNPLTNFATPYGINYDLDALHHSLEQQATQVVTDARATLLAQGISATVEVETVGGKHGIDVPAAIEARAEAWGADLIVIGTHGRRGLRRLLLGSVAEELVRLARLPVLLVRGKDA
jgi:nucleotide-binding universal stress UspA family protein